MSTDLHTLSGAYAIDALSAGEAEDFATHLERCPACRDEVRELQSAAATMGASEAVRPPAALKARVLAAADRQPQLPPKVSSLDAARSRRWTSRIVGAAAAVVLLIGAGFGVSQLQTSNDPTIASDAVTQVFHASDAHTGSVNTTEGTLRWATSQASGQLAVSTASLDSLSDRQVYQLWAIHNGRATSVGVLNDLKAGKVLPIPASGTKVALTVEPAGGSKQPTSKPFAEVDPSAV